MSAVLDVQHLQVSYHARGTRVTAVEDASLWVDQGEAVGLVGESGSGKSTLARAILGLLPERTANVGAGRIIVDGRDVTHLTAAQWADVRGRPVAIVFQDPLSFLNPLMRIKSQIAESIIRHDPQPAIGERVSELLDLLRLPGRFAGCFPHELSGGMRQRVLLAIALGCRPSLLIADEPTTALDVTTQAEILQLLQDLRSRVGMGLLLISHDLAVISALCKRVFVMYAGRTIESGPTAAVLGRPAHPYTTALLQSARGARDAAGRFITIEGEIPDRLGRQVGCAFAPRCTVPMPRCGHEMPDWFAAATDHQARCWRLQNS
jgi:oligopeptide/dipeptide ABC transporter ATP-binding protein